MDWPTLQQTAQACQACQLCKGRHGIVFGTPAAMPQADWLIVGDPPTESDEAAGTPFTGEAGVLLGNMLKAMGLSVAQVTLTPSVKCRSEGLSTGAQELAQCEAFLRRQVALSRPTMILAMGRYAAQALLANTVSNPVPPLGQLRGTVHSYQGIPVVVTYSPANLLRNPADKAKAWADLCLAKAALQNLARMRAHRLDRIQGVARRKRFRVLQHFAAIVIARHHPVIELGAVEHRNGARLGKKRKRLREYRIVERIVGRAQVALQFGLRRRAGGAHRLLRHLRC